MPAHTARHPFAIVMGACVCVCVTRIMHPNEQVHDADTMPLVMWHKCEGVCAKWELVECKYCELVWLWHDDTLECVGRRTQIQLIKSLHMSPPSSPRLRLKYMTNMKNHQQEQPTFNVPSKVI